jgi:H/ACA ribonucleoprotein complex subunit 4
MDIEEIKSKRTIGELLEFGILNIDKPAGKTSFEVDQIVLNLLGSKKTSHFGTLDPMVTGVLPIGLNRACKLSDYFMHRDKVYIGKMRIHSDISKEKLEEEIKNFEGKIKQTPPVRSSVKRVERERTINKFEVLKINGKDVEFLADVEAGTYIRKLISDLGEKIGGAHMTELRRIRAGIFEEKDSFSIEEFEKAVKKWKSKNNETELRKMIIPGEIISELYPTILVKKTRLEKIFTGKPLFDKDLETGKKSKQNKILEELNEGDKFVVFCEDKFIGIYRRTSEKIILGRALFVKN